MHVLFVLLQQNVPSILENVSLQSVALAALFLVAAWLVVGWISRFFEYLAAQSPRARLAVMRIEPVVRMLVWFQAAYLALLILAPSREMFLALIASIAIAIGFGAQDLVKNVIGGLVVLVDRPYQLGDRVQIGEAYGEIDHIGLRSTKLTAPDDTRVTIPNREVLTATIVNSNSGVPGCQVVTDIVIPYDTEPEMAIQIGYEAAYSSPFLLLSKPVSVLLMDRYDKGPYSILRVKAHVYEHRSENRMKSDITVRVKTEFLRRNLLQGCAQQE